VRAAAGVSGRLKQLCEVELRVDRVASAGANQAGEDSLGSATARIADEETVFPIKNDSFHLSL